MKEDDPAEEQGKNTGTIRSAREIKADLLHRALAGETTRTASELISMMCNAHRRAETMPENHQKTLAAIELGQPRGVLMLNALAALAGSNIRYRGAQTGAIPVSGVLTIQ